MLTVRGLPRETRGLIAAQAVFNAGFYAVIPFLVVALRDEHAQSAAAVGVILGARTLSQQGLFVVGGMLADRFGSRAMIVAGTLLRSVGFVVLLAADDFWTLLAGAVLTGLAGALFSPALEARLSRTPPTGGVSPFAWLMVVGEVGALVGPVVGVALLRHGFDTSLRFGAVLFAVAAVVLGVTLRPVDVQRGLTLRALPGGVSLRFLGFCLLASGNLLAYNQLYFLFPMALGERDTLTAGLFTGVSVVTLAAWFPLTRLAARTGPGPAVRIGFGLLVAAFVLPAAAGVTAVTVLASAGVLALGHILLTPTHQQLALSLMGDDRLRGLHLGALASCGGVVVLLGNTALGAGVDHLGPGHPAVWAGLAAVLAVPAVVLPHLVAGSPGSRRVRPSGTAPATI